MEIQLARFEETCSVLDIKLKDR